jgi:hypothetical protein
LRRLASLGSEASGRADGSGAPSSGLFASIVSRLLLCLSQMSHAAICRCVGKHPSVWTQHTSTLGGHSTKAHCDNIVQKHTVGTPYCVLTVQAAA